MPGSLDAGSFDALDELIAVARLYWTSGDCLRVTVCGGLAHDADARGEEPCAGGARLRVRATLSRVARACCRAFSTAGPKSSGIGHFLVGLQDAGDARDQIQRDRTGKFEILREMIEFAQVGFRERNIDAYLAGNAAIGGMQRDAGA